MEESGGHSMPDRPSIARRPRLSPWACSLLAGAVVFGSVLAPPYFLLVALFWAADGSWDFEGTGGWQHWLFVKGSRLERLGFVAPAGGPPKYSVRLQEGTFPGWSVVGYQSSALPAAIMTAYADRCRTMGLKVTRNTVLDAGSAADAGKASLVCEIEPYIDAEFAAEREPQAGLTHVSVRVWGSR